MGACTTTAPLTAYSTTAFLAYYPVGTRIATLATILCLWFSISLQSYHRNQPYHFHLTLSSPSYRVPSPVRPFFCASHLLYTTVYLRLSMRLIARHHTPSSFSRLLLALAATSAAPPSLFGSPAPPPSTACTTTAPLTAYSTTAFLAYYPAGSRLATLATILCLWF